MSLRALGTLLESSPQYQLLLDTLDTSTRRVHEQAQASSEGVPFLLSTLLEGLNTPILVVTPRLEDARRLHDQLLVWGGQQELSLHFPEFETLPFERMIPDLGIVQERLDVLLALDSAKHGPQIVVTSAAAIARRTIEKETFHIGRHTLRRGQRVDLEQLLDHWQRIGYQFDASIYSPGYAARRGGIADIYPIGSTLPARIELWGNEIDSIRLFDPSTQLSLEIIESVDIEPASESLPALADRNRVNRLMTSMDFSNCTDVSQERIHEELNRLLNGHEIEDLGLYAGFFNHGSLLDYFPANGLLVMYRPSEIAEVARETECRSQTLRALKEGRGELPFNFPSSQLSWSEVTEQSHNVRRALDIMAWGADDLIHRDVHLMPFAPAPTFFGRLDNFVQKSAELARDGHRVVAVTSHSKRLGEIADGYGLEVDTKDTLETLPDPGLVTVLRSGGTGLREGLILDLPEYKLAVFSDTEIFGVSKQRRSARRRSARREAILADLEPGEYIVHVEHGIGRFVSTERLPGDSEDTEYLVLDYAHGDKLYVPMEHLDRVTPYVAPMENPPALTRLGTQEWKRTKARAERSTREMATELLSLYAARELVEGHASSDDTSWQSELEESFPYEETPDQLATLRNVKDDMAAKKPMDRLVCGDVGYGKTEIAVRAAFKAVMDGKQVGVLVPTTVLAQQHYVTFSQRLSAYPTTVEVLSRFRTDAEQREILEGLANGRIDICIGTHRIIQKDVRFKDLGLVIIDEEQRFGVAHKERLKQMRREVDVLTLTATPIPRTLHMSLAGVRDMSTIETPPEDRLPIKTYVSEFSDELIREAILRELDRQGQVYFLHNRVRNIEYMAEYVRLLVPDARIGIAHGQMPEDDLEHAMIDFAEGKMDVLVCTTIIESGLDIPNVNTLIIDRADKFGLSQLYQLRGRVGRSSRRAYSYLLVPPSSTLTEAAEKRLKAMLAATELGSGFRIAMRDLEIRGAGNILGAQQSGHIHAVGFDLYTRLLRQAVEDLRVRREECGPPEAENGTELYPDTAVNRIGASGPEIRAEDAQVSQMTPRVNLGIPASIPEDYIADLPTRLDVYRRLIALSEIPAVEEMERELRDRFGPLPIQAQNLLYVSRLKLLAALAGVEWISRETDRIVIRLRDEVGGARDALVRVLGQDTEVGNTQIRLSLGHEKGRWERLLSGKLEDMANFRKRLDAGLEASAAV